MTTYQVETRTVRGVQYRVEWSYDDDHGRPEHESDGHGVTTTMYQNPANFGEDHDPEDGDLDIGEVVRHQMMRRLSSYDHVHARGVEYYDVWETMKKAKKEGWGVSNPTGLSPEEIVMAAIEKDFEYLHGWYNDHWHWCGITVIRLNAEGDDTHEESVWGYCSDDDEGHEDAITDLVSQIEYQVKKEAHKGQMPLPFETTTA